MIHTMITDPDLASHVDALWAHGEGTCDKPKERLCERLMLIQITPKGTHPKPPIQKRLIKKPNQIL